MEALAHVGMCLWPHYVPMPLIDCDRTAVCTHYSNVTIYMCYMHHIYHIYILCRTYSTPVKYPGTNYREFIQELPVWNPSGPSLGLEYRDSTGGGLLYLRTATQVKY